MRGASSGATPSILEGMTRYPEKDFKDRLVPLAVALLNIEHADDVKSPGEVFDQKIRYKSSLRKQ